MDFIMNQDSRRRSKKWLFDLKDSGKLSECQGIVDEILGWVFHLLISSSPLLLDGLHNGLAVGGTLVVALGTSNL